MWLFEKAISPWLTKEYGKIILQAVTATLSVKGQIVIPQRVRTRHQLKAGTDFSVVTRSNGHILLRPVKARRRHRTLAENLLALAGLQINNENTTSRTLDL